MPDSEAEDAEVHVRFLRSLRKTEKGGSSKASVSGTKSPAGGSVGLSDLVDSISVDTGGDLNVLKRQLQVSAKRSKVLSAPLHRQQRERVERSVAYGSARKEVGRWKGIVEQNRLADQIIFPLNQVPYRLKTAAEVVENFVPSTPLEIESAKLLQGSKYNLTNKKLYSPAELEIIKAMSLKEAREKCRELQRMRSLMSYQETKYRRTKKIKSKNYHRLLNRQKRKGAAKDLQQLLDTDPEAAQEKLEQIERDRIMERATLKHKSTGKWARHLQQHAKSDASAKEALDEQHRLAKRLTDKRQHSSSSDDDDEQQTNTDDPLSNLEKLMQEADDCQLPFELNPTSNPWLKKKLRQMRDEGNTIESTVTTEPAVIVEQKVAKKKKKKAKVEKNKSKSPQTEPQTTTADGKKEKRTKKAKRTNPADTTELDIDRLFEAAESKLRTDVLTPATVDGSSADRNDFVTVTRRTQKERKKTTTAEDVTNSSHSSATLDASRFLKADGKSLLQVSAELVEMVDGDAETTSAQQMAEAFADDDVIDEFADEKTAVEERDRPKDVDLTLPGWGGWAGPGVKGKGGKKFVIKAPEGPPRRDKLLPGVIVSETAQEPAISKFQVSSLPFPYTSVADFEAVVRHPIGRDWNADSAHRLLTEPTVVTRRGTAILPMDKRLVFDNTETRIVSDDSSGDEDDGPM